MKIRAEALAEAIQNLPDPNSYEGPDHIRVAVPEMRLETWEEYQERAFDPHEPITGMSHFLVFHRTDMGDRRRKVPRWREWVLEVNGK